MSSTALERAVDAAGGQSAFARFVGVSQPTVWAWLKHGKPLPAEFVLKTEAEFSISRHELRPDLYPLEHGSSPSGTEPAAEWPIPSAGNDCDLSGGSGGGAVAIVPEGDAAGSGAASAERSDSPGPFPAAPQGASSLPFSQTSSTTPERPQPLPDSPASSPAGEAEAA